MSSCIFNRTLRFNDMDIHEHPSMAMTLLSRILECLVVISTIIGKSAIIICVPLKFAGKLIHGGQ